MRNKLRMDIEATGSQFIALTVQTDQVIAKYS